MKIEFTKFIESLNVAVDYAEKAFLDVTPAHGMRVAVLTNRMATFMGFDEETKLLLTQAASLHDCALSEYIRDEMAAEGQVADEIDMADHCNEGERMMLNLPMYEKVKESVLCHHERADGKGALRRTPEDTPLTAQIIHMADAVEVRFNLYSCDEKKYEDIQKWVRENAGSIFTAECANAFLESVDYDTLKSIEGSKARIEFEKLMPKEMVVDISTETLRDMASVFADIADYKSHFTWRHSMGIAEKAEEMGHYYNASKEECDKLFIAGALHDVGKLVTSNDILHKEGKLTDDEYKEIQNHAAGTWALLGDIGGMEDITSWAANHHEKLDGTGYPNKFTADQLDRNSRLMACLDIYQALVEDRPYKAGMKHEEAMAILNKLGEQGKLDKDIIHDIDIHFGKKEEA